MASSDTVTFLVPGHDVTRTRGARAAGDAEWPAFRGFAGATLRHSVTLSATRGDGENAKVEAKQGDVVVIEIAGGPTLVLNPETARELLSAQGGLKTRSSSNETAQDAMPVPLRLQWTGLEAGAGKGATRSAFGDVLVKGFHVIGDLFQDKAADFAAEKIGEHVDAQVADKVYSLRRDVLPALKDEGTAHDLLPADSVTGPALVLIHGTFSSTQGTFKKLWTAHPKHVAALFSHYENRVYALDHPTLTQSPIENALTLVKALRKGTRLHLVTHSRGGLVAEVLAKVCANPKLSAADRAWFSGDEYKKQRAALTELAKLVAERDIQVERIVRVACPVRGTLLASKRLDAFVSVFKWSLELAGVPVVPSVVDFLGAVARNRAKPELLPGLAAQIPDSPLVRWLHSSGDNVAGSLRVIAGDLAGDSVTSWVKTLLADAFYWTDNDIVVQTRGMYGGPARAGGATFLLDQGGGVSHFNYFSNERTADAVLNALTQDTPAEFRPIGPESWAGKSSTGTRAAIEGAPDASDGSWPTVILVPDFLGSHLKIGSERIWLGERSAGDFHRLDCKRNESSQVEPDGILESYVDLSRHLSKSHKVIEFAYDWRLPIEGHADGLAKVIEDALKARAGGAKTQPVRILAHGMGGLLVREFAIAHPELWTKMLTNDSSRVLLLGVPNGGSWTPMQALSGDETFGGLLQELGQPLPQKSNRQILADWPGLMELQADLTDPDKKLGNAATWQTFADKDIKQFVESTTWHHSEQQKELQRWGVPARDTLARAVEFRRRLDKQAAEGFGVHASRLHCVIGTARATPDGYEDGKSEFLYRDVIDGGDGYVTTERALLPGVRAWRANFEHSALVTAKAVFDGLVQLLNVGDTKAFARVAASGARSASAPAEFRRGRPSRQPVTARPSEARDFMSVSERTTASGSRTSGQALAVSVVNGNLRFIHEPLMLGHYRSERLTGTEEVMDGLIGRTMTQLLRLGQYPDAPGTQKVLINRRNIDYEHALPRPQAVIVIGLGEEGKLTATDLTVAVRQGVIAWAHEIIERKTPPAAQFELSATLIGSGGAGVSAGQSALAIAQGVREANARLGDLNWPTVGRLTLVELFLDRATEAWRALHVQANTTAGSLRPAKQIRQEPGWLRRPLDSSYRGANYDFVTAESKKDADDNTSIAYRLDTKRARTEVHASAMQVPLLRELVVSASNDRNTDEQVGRTLFQLLIPPEVEPFLGSTTEMLLEVDPGSAGIPWELLDTGAGTRDGADTRPWAIRSKLLRKLRTTTFRPHVVDAGAEASVLVIGEPKCDDKKYGPLPGAADEARAVADRFINPQGSAAAKSNGFSPERVRRVISEEGVGQDARSIINAVLERDWRIVHIAGHGAPPETTTDPCKPSKQRIDPRGVVLSNNTYLGPREINTMRVVPELVFVNCCYLAARNPDQLLVDDCAHYDRPGFAAGVAEALIDIGVRCVIAAGWAVEDEQAKVFATTFYDGLLDGQRYIDAVAAARTAAKALGGNTWAAYQCYGDPEWVFRWKTGDAQEPTPSPEGRDSVTVQGRTGKGANPTVPPMRLATEFASVASAPSLILALETIATLSTYDRDLKPEAQLMKVGFLEQQFAKRYGRFGNVAEAFAKAYQESGDRAAAIEWYRRAVRASDASASMKATEQLWNLRARWALEQVRHSRKPDKLMKARKRIQAACQQLEAIAATHRTVERLSLCGSAWKRRAILEEIIGDDVAEMKALRTMRKWYAEAESLAQTDPKANGYYPALNGLAADLVLNGHTAGWKGFDPESLEKLKAHLDKKIRTHPDFFNVVSRTDLRLYEALAAQDLATAHEDIKREYDDLWSRVSAYGDWDSVIVQLRFVLKKYIARVPTHSEKRIARHLLKHVDTLVSPSRRKSS